MGRKYTLGNVLSFEHLLEKVLIENGYDYDYSPEKNEFVRVR